MPKITLKIFPSYRRVIDYIVKMTVTNISYGTGFIVGSFIGECFFNSIKTQFIFALIIMFHFGYIGNILAGGVKKFIYLKTRRYFGW